MNRACLLPYFFQFSDLFWGPSANRSEHLVRLNHLVVLLCRRKEECLCMLHACCRFSLFCLLFIVLYCLIIVNKLFVWLNLSFWRCFYSCTEQECLLLRECLFFALTWFFEGFPGCRELWAHDTITSVFSAFPPKSLHPLHQ